MSEEALKAQIAHQADAIAIRDTQIDRLKAACDKASKDFVLCAETMKAAKVTIEQLTNELRIERIKGHGKPD